MKEITNVTFTELKVGQSATIKRKITEKDIKTFAYLSHDVNPVHLDEKYAKTTIFKGRIAHGMLGGALLSAVLGTKLPGPGAIYLNQSLSFKKPIKIGDTIESTVTVLKKNSKNKRVIFACKCINQKKELVIEGQAELIAPNEKYSEKLDEMPKILLCDEGKKLRQLVAKASKIPKKLKVAIIHPTSDQSIAGAVLAAQNNLIEPIFVGPFTKMHKAATKNRIDLSQYQCIDAENETEAAKKAVELVNSGKVTALMKGEMHTDALMHIVLSKEHGLRTERRISHCLAMDIPDYHKIVFISDVAVNILPDVKTKKDIIKNTIDFLHTLGIKKPKIALLSAVEIVLENMPSTKEAAELTEMAKRGEITGAIIDGPLAFDVAISKAAAKAKNVKSKVAGDPDVFIVPNIEAGNIMIKQLEYLSHAHYAGLVLGARAPIILTSRFVEPIERLASCALAKIYLAKSHRR